MGGARGRRLKSRLWAPRNPACAGFPIRPDPVFVSPILARPQPAAAGFVAQPPGATSVAGPSTAGPSLCSLSTGVDEQG
jgi:hypothetical protein